MDAGGNMIILIILAIIAPFFISIGFEVESMAEAFGFILSPIFFLGIAGSIDVITSGKKEPVPVGLRYLYGEYFGPTRVSQIMVDLPLLAGISAVLVSIVSIVLLPQHLNGWLWLLFGMGHICLAHLLDQLRKKKLPPSKVAMNIALLLAICPPIVFTLFAILS